MLLAMSELDKISNFLDGLINKEKIFKYKIYFNLNTSISIDIVADRNDELKSEIEQYSNVKICIEEWISKEDYNNDAYYQNNFKEKIDKKHRRRLSNLINNNNSNNNSNIPITTFYSYKGGVGRTTSLITFANYYAYHYNKKVVILDFDFEAPGLTNYFDFSLDSMDNKNGVLEYLLDKESSREKLRLTEKYMIEVSREYTGEGSIFVMPAGSLYTEENLDSYIEALARIDINSTDVIIKQIIDLIQDIKEELNPDVILIDSRTGFNDVFGFLINKISSMVIGLFEDNIQTKPGLNLFINEIFRNNINSILVNSLVHKDSGYNKRFKAFSEKVSDYIISITEESSTPNILELRKSNILGNLGTIEDDKEDYFDFIKSNTPNDYKNFFEKIIDLIENKKAYTANNIQTTEPKCLRIVKKTPEILEEIDCDLINNSRRKVILDKIYQNYPDSYADNMSFDESFLNEKFYYRKCMEDIFNFDKLLLIGGKGTGKTAFYKALTHDIFITNLKNKANKKPHKFSVVDIISLETENKNKHFNTKNFNQEKIIDKEFFYKRFWTTYILNSILIDTSCIDNYEMSVSIKGIFPKKLTNSTEDKLFFEDIIENDKKFILVEKELSLIDLHLKKKDINLIITFDQLDFIVKPILWPNIISPLIDYCRSLNYVKIKPKLFLRRDLYKKLTNLTNKNLLDSKTINLEWSKDEIFAFFFKIVFAYAKNEFFEVMKDYADVQPDIIESIIKKINQKNNYNQISLDTNYIKSLVSTFFGKYPNTFSNKSIKYEETYSWFYTSLANADETISLRPFLDLIKYSIESFLEKGTDAYKPILNPYFYNSNFNRKKCVEKYVEDLSNEEGNEDLKKIMEHIRSSSRFPNNLKFRRLQGKDCDTFFSYFLNNLSLDCQTKEDIEELLIVNGIISLHYINMNTKAFSFAYLYKYYLNLRK